MIDETTITIWTPAWGEKHLGYLQRFAIPSLLQPDNLTACAYGKILVRGSTVGDTGPLQSVLAAGFSGVPGVEIRVNSAPHHEAALIGNLRGVVRECVSRNSRFMLLMPDTLIANGGMLNMLRYAHRKPVSVAAPHLRVDAAQFCGEFGDWFTKTKVVSPSQLVASAMRCPHQSFIDSYTIRENGTYAGGIAITDIGPRTATIIHYLPTVYLAWFTLEDLAFFDHAAVFGQWDHDWCRVLANSGRLRVFGDSSLFFAVELTDAGSNRIPLARGSALEEDSNQGLPWMKCFVGGLHG